MLQRELQLRFGRDLNLIAFLHDCADAAGDCADGRSHSCVSCDGSDRGAQSSAPEKAESRAAARAFAFGGIGAGDDGIRIPADYDLRQLEFELRFAGGAAGGICECHLAIDRRARVSDHQAIGEICDEGGGKYLAGLSIAGVQLVGGLNQDEGIGRDCDHLRGLGRLRRRGRHGAEGERGDEAGRICIRDSVWPRELNSLRRAGDELAVDYLTGGEPKRVGRGGERQCEAEDAQEQDS